jgi:hypothetical protein
MPALIAETKLLRIAATGEQNLVVIQINAPYYKDSLDTWFSSVAISGLETLSPEMPGLDSLGALMAALGFAFSQLRAEIQKGCKFVHPDQKDFEYDPFESFIFYLKK